MGYGTSGMFVPRHPHPHRDGSIRNSRNVVPKQRRKRKGRRRAAPSRKRTSIPDFRRQGGFRDGQRPVHRDRLFRKTVCRTAMLRSGPYGVWNGMFAPRHTHPHRDGSIRNSRNVVPNATPKKEEPQERPNCPSRKRASMFDFADEADSVSGKGKPIRGQFFGKQRGDCDASFRVLQVI